MVHPLAHKYPLHVIFFTIFVDMLGVGILIPVIPLLLADPSSAYYLLPHGMSVGSGYILLGFLSGVYPLAQFFATPLLGQLSDRYGRKIILAVSLFGTFLSYIIFAVGIIFRNIPLLFLARAFDGITGGNISVAQAAIADVTPPEKRAKNFGLIGMAFGLGFIMGPFIGGKLSDPHVVYWFSATSPFWFASLLTLLNVVSVIFLFPETLKTAFVSKTFHWAQSVHNIFQAVTTKGVRVLFATNFFLQAGFSFFFTFFSVYLIQKFSFHQGNIGDFFAYIGLWVAFTQGFLTRKIASKVEESKILKITILGVGLTVLLYFFPTYGWELLFIAPVFAICNGLTQANLLGLISRSADAGIQGEILGINASVQALAQSIPPIISGIIAARLTPETPILVSSSVLLMAWGIFMKFYKPKTVIHAVVAS